MRIGILAIVLLLLSITASAEQLLIGNVTLLSAERKQPMTHAYVRIVGGKIAQVSSTPLKRQKTDTFIDGSGKYLTPGLMDSHVHVSSMPGVLLDGDKPAAKMAPLERLFFHQQPRSYLYFGVTQLLDPSNSKTALANFNVHKIRPDLFHCGAVPILGGYPTLWASEQSTRKTFDYLLDPKDPEHTPEAVVRRMASDGALCVKVFIEDGFGKANDWPMISRQQLAKLKAAATKYHLPLMAHANAVDMQAIALEAGADIIAHGLWNWLDDDGKPGLPRAEKQVLDDVIRHHVVFQPTFNVMDGIKGVTVPGVLDDPLYTKAVPAELLAWYHSKEGQWFSREMIAGFGGGQLEKIHQRQDRIIAQGERAVAYLDRQGYPLVLASDTPSSPTYAAQPGYSTFAELKHLHKAGVSLLRVFEAATINSAKAFGVDDRYGTIEVGKAANLLLLTQSPLESIEAYNAIDKVVLHGQVIERETLAADHGQ